MIKDKKAAMIPLICFLALVSIAYAVDDVQNIYGSGNITVTYNGTNYTISVTSDNTKINKTGDSITTLNVTTYQKYKGGGADYTISKYGDSLNFSGLGVPMFIRQLAANVTQPQSAQQVIVTAPTYKMVNGSGASILYGLQNENNATFAYVGRTNMNWLNTTSYQTEFTVLLRNTTTDTTVTNTVFRVYSNKTVNMPALVGAGNRMVCVDSLGNIYAGNATSC